MFDLQNLVRENIRRLVPYSSARKEYAGAAEIFLDANENSFGSPLGANYNRYPDPAQMKIKERVREMHQAAGIADLQTSEIFIGNGSDEAIDLLFRIFCEPRRDNVLICPPTYGMYEVSAAVNDVSVRRAFLTDDFELDLRALEKAPDARTKLLFICSPNNPTGNAFAPARIVELAKRFGGIVVVDEAYAHFSSRGSMLAELRNLPNLVVLQTFSKAWGLAGLRVGLAFASAEIIALFNKVKPPYNVSGIAQAAISDALKNIGAVEKTVAEIIAERERLIEKLREFSVVVRIYPSDANFVLVKTTDADGIYEFLTNEKIIVRHRGNVELCEGCLRITVGTRKENESLLRALRRFQSPGEANSRRPEILS